MTQALRSVAIPEPQTFTIDSVDDVRVFAGLQQEWNELLRASGSDSPFLTWEWLYSWWRHLAGTASLRLLCVRADGRLVAIAPFMVKDSAMRWFRTLEFLGTGHAGSDYLDVIVRRGFEADAIHTLADYIGQDPVSLRLDHIPQGSVAATLSARLAGAGWRQRIAPAGTCPIIQLAGHTWDSYLATLGSAHRANVRRRLRAMAREFELQFETVSTHAVRQEALAALIRFHEDRFQTDGGSTAFLSPALEAFHDEATARALDGGTLRMFVLRLNGAVAGVMYGFFHGGQFFFYQHGFDDRYRAQSAGLVVMALSIQAAIDEGARTFDMLWGVEPYKWLWTRETRTLQLIQLFPAHARGELHRHAHDARRHLGRIARRVMTIGDPRVS